MWENPGRRINVLYAIQSKYLGGAEIALLNILKSINRKKIRPFVISRLDGQAIRMFKKNDIQGEVVTGKGWNARKDRISEFIKNHKIVLVHNITLDFTEPAVAAKVAKIPHIWHIFGDAPSIYPGLDKLLGRRFVELMYALSSRIIICINFARKQFMTLNINRKIMVIHNSVYPGNLDRQATQRRLMFRERFSVKKGDFLVGMVARFDPQKRHVDFIKAAVSLIRKHPDLNLKFAMVGADLPSKYLNGLKRLNQKHNNGMIFTGQCNKPADIMNAIDLLVMPAVNDALPMVILEAMTYKKPVIGADSGGIPEAIRHEKTGLLTSPANPKALERAMLRIISDRKFAKTLGENAGKMIRERFDARKISASIERVYDRSLK